MKKFNFDSFVLTTGQLIIFIFASVISCVINLLFIGNLSETTMTVAGVAISPSVIMISIAVCLELAKLFSITMRNTLEELNRKIKKEYRSKAMKRIANIWLATYLFYALLAITSAVNFSLGNLGKEDIQSSYNVEILSSTKKDFEIIEKSLKDKQAELLSLDNEKNKKLANADSEFKKEFAEYKELYYKASENMDYYNSIYPNGFWGNVEELTDDKVKSVVLYRNKVRRELGLANGWNSLVSLQNIIKAKYSSKAINEEYSKKENLVNKDISDLQNRKAYICNSEISLNKVDNGTQVKYKVKIENYDNVCRLLKEEKLSQNVDAGTQISLRMASEMILNFLHKDGDITDYLRIGFLLILSILVEITIFQTSPKVKLDRKSIYQFSRFLPEDFDIDTFMVGLDHELEMYGFLPRAEKNDDKKESKRIDTIKSNDKCDTVKSIDSSKVVEEKVENIHICDTYNDVTDNAEEINEVSPVSAEKAPLEIERTDIKETDDFDGNFVDTPEPEIKENPREIKEFFIGTLTDNTGISIKDSRDYSELIEKFEKRLPKLRKPTDVNNKIDAYLKEIKEERVKLAEEQRVLEQKLLEEQRRFEEEKRLGEQKQIEEEKAKEQERIEEQKRLEEERKEKERLENERKLASEKEQVEKKSKSKKKIAKKKKENKEVSENAVKEDNPSEQPEQETKIVSNEKAEKLPEDIKSYRLGKTTEKVKQKFIEFIDALYRDSVYNSDTKKYEFTDYALSDEFDSISQKNKETILKRLLDIKYMLNKKEHTVVEMLNEKMFSYMDKEELVKYLTEIV